MLGDLIANLDRPGVAAAVLTTLDPVVAAQIERRAAAEAMAVADFAAGAVRNFMERADDELWLQLLTIVIARSSHPTPPSRSTQSHVWAGTVTGKSDRRF
jgi:hypothetical protein